VHKVLNVRGGCHKSVHELLYIRRDATVGCTSCLCEGIPQLCAQTVDVRRMPPAACCSSAACDSCVQHAELVERSLSCACAVVASFSDPGALVSSDCALGSNV
jgi:hypothetical protein